MFYQTRLAVLTKEQKGITLKSILSIQVCENLCHFPLFRIRVHCIS